MNKELLLDQLWNQIKKYNAKTSSKWFSQNNGDSDADSEFNFENYYSKKNTKKGEGNLLPRISG